nr:basic salivary proline-rich protein 4-like [Kogia breviceps]
MCPATKFARWFITSFASHFNADTSLKGKGPAPPPQPPPGRPEGRSPPGSPGAPPPQHGVPEAGAEGEVAAAVQRRLHPRRPRARAGVQARGGRRRRRPPSSGPGARRLLPAPVRPARPSRPLPAEALRKASRAFQNLPRPEAPEIRTISARGVQGHPGAIEKEDGMSRQPQTTPLSTATPLSHHPSQTGALSPGKKEGDKDPEEKNGPETRQQMSEDTQPLKIPEGEKKGSHHP